MSNIVYQGQIDGEFEGFDDNKVFKMANGTYWIQARYSYWYHYAYCPKVLISAENNQYSLSVLGRSVPIERLDSVIESRIDGTFNGWSDKKQYKLTNGQVWQQAEYKYVYKYAYRPEVLIYRNNGRYIMSVCGTSVTVKKV